MEREVAAPVVARHAAGWCGDGRFAAAARITRKHLFPASDA